MDKFPFYSQLDMMDCGPACLRMIAKYYGNSYSLEMLRSHSFISREGVSMLDGFVFQMEPKIGTVVYRTARTVV
jgi:ABC-type bacteriocin/lantibiotic exporter with double-glycine peptidase domain